MQSTGMGNGFLKSLAGSIQVLLIYLLIGLSVLVVCSAQASEPVWLLEDPTGELTVLDVMAKSEEFTLTDNTTRGMTDSVFWVRVDLINDSDSNKLQLVTFDSISLPKVIEYSVKQDQIETKLNGYAVPFEQRSAKGINIVFPNNIDANSQRQVIYKISSDYKVDLGFKIIEGPDDTLQTDQLMVKLLIIGAFLMLLLYNLFMAIASRLKIYAIYCTFLASALVISICFFRFYEYFGVSVDPLWLEGRIGIVLYASAFWFLTNLFKDDQTPILKKIAPFYYLMVFAHVLLDPGTQFYVYAHVTGPIIFSVLTYTLLVSVKAGNPIAKFMAVGWGVYFIFSSLFLGNLVGLLGTEFELYLAYGNLFEGIVGSTVLAYRMRNIAHTEERLKQVSYELARERLSSDIGYGFKWEIDIDKQLIRPDATFARWHGFNWISDHWYPLKELNTNQSPNWLASLEETISNVTGPLNDASKDTFDLTSPMTRADNGQDIWVKHHGKVLDIGDQRLLVGISLEITDLTNTKNRLQSNLDKQKELFAIIGHELRTPVAAIAMLAEDRDQSPDAKIKTIRDIAESLTSILEDMRTVVSPERAQLAAFKVVNPLDVVSRSSHLLLPMAEERNIKLITKLNSNAAQNAVYNIQEQALRQLTTNLTKNAILHSEGTMVCVSFTLTQIDNDKTEATLEVMDNGKGIPRDSIQNLYEPFTRGESVQDGTGLGLFISKDIAHTLNSDLYYTDSPDGGACFSVTFQMSRSNYDPEPFEQNLLKGKRILLAEDDSVLRLLTEKKLTKEGALVSAYDNGQRALDHYEDGKYDLILTDIMMPKLDGYGLLTALRAQGCELPIIAVTAAVIGAETDKIVKLGADGFISKPIKLPELYELYAAYQASVVEEPQHSKT